MRADYCNPWYYQSFNDEILTLLKRKGICPKAHSIEWHDGVFQVKDDKGGPLMIAGLGMWSVFVRELTGTFDEQLPNPFGREDEGGDINHLIPPTESDEE
jgi:hypothetical protein